MPSLRRDEAAARAALLHVDAYDVHLDFSGAVAGESFGSTATVRFSCAEPGAQTFAEIRALSVEDVRLNGTALDPALIEDGRIPLTGLAADNELTVRATMPYSRSGEGVHHFRDPEDGETYLWGMSGLDNAQRVFACFDQPDLKAVFRLSVTAPAEWTVWGNASGTTDGTGHWRFAPTERISTYLTTVVAGPYHCVHDEHAGVPLGLLSRQATAATLEADAEEIFAVTRACLDRYHELFGIRYPFGEYRMAFVPEFNWGAVENPGCITFHEDNLFTDAVTDAQRETRAVIIAHEMAHMWFGDLVTLRWWDDIWLNESFAEYMGWRVAVEATEFTDAWTGFAVGRKSWGYAADRRRSTHPIAPDEVTDTAGALLNFDGISYAKGAAVLRQLVAWLGDDAFTAGVAAYLKRHAYGNATLADLLAALSDAGGRDLDAWAEAWLRDPGTDTLVPETATDAAGRYTRVAVRGTAPGGRPSPRPHRIGAAVYRLADGVVHKHAVDLETPPAAGTVDVPGLTGELAGLLLLNDGDLSFAKIRFDDAGRAALPEYLPAIGDPLARALIWGAAAEAVGDGAFTVDEFLRLAVAGLPAETNVAVFEDVRRFLARTVTGAYLPPERRPAALTALTGAAETVLDSGDPRRRLAAVRTIVDCTDATGAARLEDWLDGRDLPTGVAMDADLRWTLLHRLAVLGLAGEHRIAEETDRDRSARGAARAARIRAARPDTLAKETAWTLLTSDTSVSGVIAAATAEGFWQPEQNTLAAPYAARFFADAPDMFALHGPQVGRSLIGAAFPYCAVADATAEAAEAFLTRPDLPVALRRTVADAADDLRRALAVRERG